jgi:hypothetical protein
LLTSKSIAQTSVLCFFSPITGSSFIRPQSKHINLNTLPFHPCIKHCSCYVSYFCAGFC